MQQPVRPLQMTLEAGLLVSLCLFGTLPSAVLCTTTQDAPLSDLVAHLHMQSVSSKTPCVGLRTCANHAADASLWTTTSNNQAKHGGADLVSSRHHKTL